MSGSRVRRLAFVFAAGLWGPGRAWSARPLLGVSYPAGRGGFSDCAAHLRRLKGLGFGLVALVPSYSYVGRNRIDFSGGPDWDRLQEALDQALAAGFVVVLKPHLDPPVYEPGFDPFESDNHSWRLDCPWRGYFDVDPMSDDYRERLIGRFLSLLREAFSKAGSRAPPVRLELGAELMDSEVHGPGRWEELLAWAKKERARLGLEGRVLFSHNFAHHIELPEDHVLRMSPDGRKSLARYISALDAVALSQYMDLTVAVPAAERSRRLPAAAEVAAALLRHEEAFRRDILEGLLGLKASEVPPLHVGEFGVGRGGLKHPNLWAGAATPAQEERLSREIALGHAGLALYLAGQGRRRVQSAVLWVTGRHYDIFGFSDPAWAVPAAADAVKAYLGGR